MSEIYSEQTLLDRIGGPAALDLAVELFYDKLVVDEALSVFFEDINMQQLRSHQKKFLTLALTEVPKDIDVPKLMLEKHQKLFSIGLNESHFDMVAGHLVSTLEELQVRTALIDEVVARIAPLRSVFEQGAKQFEDVGEEKKVSYFLLWV
jgi:hemoglobin